MRIRLTSCIFLLSLLFSFTVSAQDTLVSWKASAVRSSATTYQLTVKGVMKKGFHIYAKDDADGLAGLTLVLKDASVTQGAVTISPAFAEFKDPIFENNKR